MRKDKDLIDEFGKIIDQQLKEHEIKLLITLPKDSMDAEIKSPYGDIGVMNLYIMLYGLKKVVQDVVSQADIDESKLGDMLDGMFDMVKKEILEEGDKKDV